MEFITKLLIGVIFIIIFYLMQFLYYKLRIWLIDWGQKPLEKDSILYKIMVKYKK